jgi:hypothetical protein
MNRFFSSALALSLFSASFLSASIPAFADTLVGTSTDGVTRNTFEYFSTPNGISWTDANAAANLLGGFLAVVDTQAENNFVAAKLALNAPMLYNQIGVGPWLGASNTVGPGPGNFHWVNGAPFIYQPWGGGQPDNFEGFPQGLVYYNGGLHGSDWGDYAQDPASVGFPAGRVLGYIVEHRAVPEPASFVLICLGGFGLVLGAYRRLRVAA